MKSRNRVERLKIVVVIWSCLWMLPSCSSTKFVPQGNYLLNDVEVHVDNKKFAREKLKAQLKQEENQKILGFLKFHLGLYNLSSQKKSDGWLKRIGEAPVVFSRSQTDLSKKQLLIFLQNKGFYNARVRDTIVYYRRKRKVDVTYWIQTGQPYIIRKYGYHIADKRIAPLVLADSVHQTVRRGIRFDVERLNSERTRLTQLMKNNGYYDFSEECVQFLADTTVGNHRVDLTLEIADADQRFHSDSVVPFKRYVVRSYQIAPDYVPVLFRQRGKTFALDTLNQSPYRFIFRNRLNYKPAVFETINRMIDHPYFSLNAVEQTYRSLIQLRQFKVVNLKFQKVDSLANDSIGVLDSYWNLTRMPRQGFSVDAEGTNSSGNMGVAGNLTYQHRNLFRGAEIFSVNLRGAFEREQAVVDNSHMNFNTQELGLESSLTFPKFLAPIRREKLFNYQTPKTSLSVGYNYQHRPDYTRTITNLKYGYSWKTSSSQYHYLNIVDFNYVGMSKFNTDFLNSIRDLYIKSSFTDHLIAAMDYTYVDNNQNPSVRSDYHYFKWTFESAGNLLSAYSSLTGKDKTASLDSATQVVNHYHTFFGTRFAQYLKSDLEYRYGHMIDRYSSLVGRAFVGVGLPYGNFDILPYEKKYFAGGANGIRAWQVRTLGPGTYKAASGSYPNQSGDIKLEANLEYRYQLIGRVEGAFFLDAGNIWAINQKDNREGAQFLFNKFYRQVALGTGTGLRFNFTYFIFRLDLGMKLRDPSLESGKRFIPWNYPITGKDFHLSFAIGYPF